MKSPLRRGSQWVLLVAVLGLLLSGPIPSGTGTAWAKPYPIVTGPEPTNGDPTGDDRPSPTPKSTGRVAMASTGSYVKVRDGRVVSVSFGAWSWYLRHLMFLALR